MTDHRTLFFKPNLPEFEVVKRSPATSLKIGLVGSIRMVTCMEFEATIYLLTEQNWDSMVAFAGLDMVIVESVFKAATGDFKEFWNPNSQGHKILKELLSQCQRKHIPTIFWQTETKSYNSYFKNYVGFFDFIFCSDSDSIPEYQKINRNVFFLLPAIQPAIHNPLVNHFNRQKHSVEILYNFWSDIFFSTVDLALLEGLASLGLIITDTEIRQWEKRLLDSHSLAENISGVMRLNDFWNILKYTRFFLTMDQTNFSYIIQAQQILEAAGSGSMCLHYSQKKTKSEYDFPKCCQLFDNRSDLIEFVRELKEEELYREHKAQFGWRNSHGNHTYAHRLEKICSIVGVKNDWNEYPKCSMIFPTNKPEYIPRIVENGIKQTYPNKEMLVAINSDDVNIKRFEEEYAQIEFMRFVHIPENQTIGRALNVGVSLSNGEYCFKMDDDDMYGKHYIEDCVYHLRSYPADFWGKPPAVWLHFESDNQIYKRRYTKATKNPCVAIKSEELVTSNVSFGGNTLGFKKEALLRCPFPEDLVGSVDSEIQIKYSSEQKKIIFLDSTGVIVERRKDKSRHNWRMADEDIKQKSQKVKKDDAISFALCEKGQI